MQLVIDKHTQMAHARQLQEEVSCSSLSYPDALPAICTIFTMEGSLTCMYCFKLVRVLSKYLPVINVLARAHTPRAHAHTVDSSMQEIGL